MVAIIDFMIAIREHDEVCHNVSSRGAQRQKELEEPEVTPGIFVGPRAHTNNEEWGREYHSQGELLYWSN